jgi:hypothetical protein
MPNYPSAIAPLVASLTWLAAPAEQQIEELMRLGAGSWVDALVQDFDEAMRLATWRRRPILGDEALVVLEQLDELILELGAEPEAWTFTALCEHPGWQRVRRTAIRALAALCESCPTLEPVSRVAARA